MSPSTAPNARLVRVGASVALAKSEDSLCSASKTSLTPQGLGKEYPTFVPYWQVRKTGLRAPRSQHSPLAQAWVFLAWSRWPSFPSWKSVCVQEKTFLLPWLWELLRWMSWKFYILNHFYVFSKLFLVERIKIISLDSSGKSACWVYCVQGWELDCSWVPRLSVRDQVLPHMRAGLLWMIGHGVTEAS